MIYRISLSFLPRRFCRGVLLATEPERSARFAASDSALFAESCRTRIDERKRVTNASEVVPPADQFISNFDGTHWSSGIFIKNCKNKIRPRYLGMNLLSQSILETDLCRLQLCDFCIQASAVTSLLLYLLPDVTEGVLECVHHIHTLYRQNVRSNSVFIRQSRGTRRKRRFRVTKKRC
jgi:hypothetical protein